MIGPLALAVAIGLAAAAFVRVWDNIANSGDDYDRWRCL